MESTAFEPFEPVLGDATEPIVMPVPAGAVKVLPRWSEQDEVLRWRLKYRACKQGGAEDGWTELELRPFTRELPLTGLHHGHPHIFKVALETTNGWSGWSHEVLCTPPPPEVPGKCAACIAIVKDDTTALIRWTRPIDFAAAAACGQILRYKLLVTWEPQPLSHEDSQNCWREIIIDEDTDCYEVENLRCLRNYRFQVTAENSSGWGEYSDLSPVLTMPMPVPPTLPEPSMRKATHYTAVIQWQHPPTTDVPVTSFIVRHTTSKDWSHSVGEVHNVPANLSQHVIQGLQPGETYIFQVRATNKYGMGIWSDNSIPIKTLDGGPPYKIKDVHVDPSFKSFITLKWSPAFENGYEVERHLLRSSHTHDMSNATEMTPTVTRKTAADGSVADSCDLRHLQKTCWYFQVAAVNKMGPSQWCDPIEVDLSVIPKLQDA